jgi:Fur family transcriptional regulator, ferric uptake regulator
MIGVQRVNLCIIQQPRPPIIERLVRRGAPGGRTCLDNQQIKEAGLKVTRPRERILGVLERGGGRHLSAEDVYKELLGSGDDISLATVYRVLTQFEGAGLVCRRHFETGQSVFELNRGNHHDHLVCIRCNRVVEFADPLIEAQQSAIAAAHGFQIQDHSLVIYGVCGDCIQRSAVGKSAGG